MMSNLNKKFSEFLSEGEQIDKVTRGAEPVEPMKKLQDAEVIDLGGATYDEPSGNADIGTRATKTLKQVHDVVNKNAKAAVPMKKLEGTKATEPDKPKMNATKDLEDISGEAGLTPKKENKQRKDSFFESNESDEFSDLDELFETFNEDEIENLYEISSDRLKRYINGSWKPVKDINGEVTNRTYSIPATRNGNRYNGNLKAANILYKRGEKVPDVWKDKVAGSPAKPPMTKKDGMFEPNPRKPTDKFYKKPEDRPKLSDKTESYDEFSDLDNLESLEEISSERLSDYVKKSFSRNEIDKMHPSKGGMKHFEKRGAGTSKAINILKKRGIEPYSMKERDVKTESYDEFSDLDNLESLEEISSERLSDYVKKSFSRNEIDKMHPSKGGMKHFEKRGAGTSKAINILKKRGIEPYSMKESEDDDNLGSELGNLFKQADKIGSKYQTGKKAKMKGSDSERSLSDVFDAKSKEKTRVKVYSKDYKPYMKEDVEAVFNGQNITEETKEKTIFLIETAISEKVKTIIEELEEEFNIQLEEAIEEVKQELEEEIKASHQYIVSEWLLENNIAIERGLRAEIMESFFSDLKGLFESHNIDIPVESEDIVYELSQESQQKEQALNEQIEKNSSLLQENIELQRKLIILEKTSSLADTQKEKIASLAESVDFINESIFSKKIDILIESYYSKPSNKQAELLMSGDDEVKSTVVETIDNKPQKSSALFGVMSKFAK